VRHGLVVEEILDEAHAGNYDLVVIGAHHYEGWTSFLLDNLARQIITQMDRPVLLVR
jgi:nucleotide-binding universal stress UspA family protein